MAHTQPSLPRTKHRTGAQVTIQIHLNTHPPTRIPRIIRRKISFEDMLIRIRTAISFLLPAFHAAAVYVWTEGETRIAGLANTETVGVGKGIGEGDLGRFIAHAPDVGHEEALRFEEGWVGAGFDLGTGPVEFPDLGIVGWEC